MSNNVVLHQQSVYRSERNSKNKHKSGVLWLTGLSASGKSTIAYALDRRFIDSGVISYVLDGDNIRSGLNADLGFSPGDRKENLRRVSEISKLFIDAGVVVIAAFISPLQSDRDFVKSHFNKEDFLEVYVKCSIEECEKRDPKGQYKKVKDGLIKNYTGISSPYEEPLNPDLIIDTEKTSIKEAVSLIHSTFLY